MKIKGGKVTVFRFFLVSVAYTSVWLAVSSQLVYYRKLYGPQVLLQLNLAYYAPSIPLLIFQSFFDEALESAFGVAKTILIRLVTGLVGYGAICACLPFMPARLDYLLWSVLGLGACSGLAFSASYQLVARFANKNVIALGLGCTASAPLVLILQLAMKLGHSPSHRQAVYLYESIAVLVAAGLWATVSLLLRHWDAIEASAQPQEEIQEPLLGGEDGAADAMEGGSPLASAGGSALLGARSPRTLKRHPSLPPLLAYNQLEPYQTYLTDVDWPAHLDWQGRPRRRSFSHGRREHSVLTEERQSRENWAGEGAMPQLRVTRSQSLPPNLEVRLATKLGLSGLRPLESAEEVEEEAASAVGSGHEDLASNAGGSSQSEGAQAAVLTAIRLTWPALAAVGVQSGIALTLFPFFTYLPSSGLLGDALPVWMFYGRVFADIIGRMLPRIKALAPSSIWPVVAVAGAHLACEPLFFVYLKSPPRFHNDVLAVAYIMVMWCASGYVNTAANMCAPKLVPPELRSTAAGLMALCYQLGHVLALALAIALAAVLFKTDIGTP